MDCDDKWIKQHIRITPLSVEARNPEYSVLFKGDEKILHRKK